MGATPGKLEKVSAHRAWAVSVRVPFFPIDRGRSFPGMRAASFPERPSGARQAMPVPGNWLPWPQGKEDCHDE